jgi:hypothetical protein
LIDKVALIHPHNPAEAPALAVAGQRWHVFLPCIAAPLSGLRVQPIIRYSWVPAADSVDIARHAAISSM